jgi:hypothetical protein
MKRHPMSSIARARGPSIANADWASAMETITINLEWQKNFNNLETI